VSVTAQDVDASVLAGSLKMICCDLCLEWFHWQCVGLNKTVIQKNAPRLCALCAQSTC